MTLTAPQRGAAQQQLHTAIAVPPTPPPTGAMLAVDVSNYSSELTTEALEAWKQDGVGLVIVQAFPWNYKQYQQQQRQMQQVRAAGFRLEMYIYDYLAGPGWRDAALQGLQGSGVQRVWADEEDVQPEAQQMALHERIAAVQATLDAIDKAGYQTGVYSGAWWWAGTYRNGEWSGYMANTTIFQTYALWDSFYDGVPDVNVNWRPYGGWSGRAMKQHQGTTTYRGVSGVDLDVTAG